MIHDSVAIPAHGSSASHHADADRRLRPTVIGLIAFLTVVDLFAAQALLPSLVVHYQTTPAVMGLAVNSCTLGMALGGLAVAFNGHRIERRLGIASCLLVLTLPTLALAFAPNIAAFAALRIVQGLLMSSAFGLTLAHIGEAVAPEQMASTFAVYITGNVASNLGGRLIAAAVVDQAGLAASFAVFAALNLAGALLVLAVVGKTRSVAQGLASGIGKASVWRSLFQIQSLRAAFSIGFSILFIFIGVFTYVNFVLTRPPLSVSMMQLGLVYFVFLPSILTTPFAGRLSQRFGTGRGIQLSLGLAGLGLPLLLASQLAFVLIGMTLVAVGTFAAQALATGYVSQTSGQNRAAAGGIYLFSYFLGGLAGTALLGHVFDRLGWTATISCIGLVLVIAMATAQFAAEKSRSESGF